MGLLRDRHDGSPQMMRFKMQTDLLSIGDDSWVEDAAGNRVYKVNGKAMRLRDTWILEDMAGREMAKIRERKLSVRDAMTIEFGDRDATVKKALVGIRKRFRIEVDGGDDLKAHGNFLEHEYEIESDDGTIGTVSKKWFRVRDTYGVEVAPGIDAAMILSITVAIDAMSRDGD